MNLPKITIIVAVYNTEKYLHKCIESIINQTHQNLEIFLVDDGSTDASSAICDDYAKADKRIKVLHKTNGGQGSARNLALEAATGEWIGFVDSDDWIDVDMYEFLLSKALAENADIAECGWKKVNVDGSVEFTTPPKKTIIDREKAMHGLVYGGVEGVNTSVCNKIFRRSCIANIRFPQVRAYEDDEFIHKVIWNARNISINGEAKYNYLSRPESTMTAGFNLNKLALITVQENICEFLKENATQYFYKAQKTLCSKQFYIIACLLNNPELDDHKSIAFQIEQDVMASYKSYMKNPIMGNNKFVLRLFTFAPSIGRALLIYKF
ncbi:glycosyltransferase family 2 protein [Chryseobacterium salivictor]|uniref:Glycosyltransferase EpsH n=1 Tax=Chryseobacterium salivictor TaxID=2547600 RepID=A0A4P6ZIJ2_9FLAO|nr:glycosyltransferase [Chryseobacterium salivictor]QBO59680.1 Putative glycosyltransferase EpsH [Chryseobacterium salivictor]